MINKNDLRKAISSIAISNAKRNTIYKAFSDLDSITKEEFDSVKSDISKVVESMLTKDTVGKANGVASLDSNGSVPIEQLGNIDTTLFLIVRELPTTNIQSNKIYLVPNQDGQGNNVYIEYLYVEDVWKKVGEFKPEVDLSHIEAKLETKADKEDVDNRLGDLSNYCVKLEGNDGISFPFSDIVSVNNNIKQLNSNSTDEHYIYADLSQALDTDEMPHYIYDKTSIKLIKIVKADSFSIIPEGDFFNTAEPLDLTHTFYLDNEKIGIVENLSQLTIEESNVFVNLPYIEVDDNLDDNTAPQYIYDATDNKWIEVVETHYIDLYIAFNTEELLDLTHELYYSGDTTIVNWTSVGEGSISLGNSSSAEGYYSLAIGIGAHSRSDNSIVIGNNSESIGGSSLAIGESALSKGGRSTALGAYSKTGGDYAIALGDNVSNTKSIFGVGFDGVNGIDMDRDNYGLYLKGFGGYNGTNLVVKNKGTETLNPNIKCVQQIINEKADASAIPTKVSQLTNDSNFVTPNDNAIFAGLTIHNNAQIRYIQKYNHEGKATYLIAETPADRVANKVYAADGSLFDVGKLVKKVQCSVSGDRNNIEFGYTTVDDTYNFSVVPTVTTNHSGIMTAADKVKLDSLPSITSKLSNITTAATAEEVVTKFNALLADLKAKGYMEADTPQ